MNTTIKPGGLPTPPPSSGSSGSVGGSSADAAGAAGSSGSASAGAVRGDRVQLTDSAKALGEVARSQDASSVDMHRVERVRQALADGSYQVDAQRVADKLISLEKQIG